MQDLGKKVIVNLLSHPATIIPTVVGFTAIIISWPVGSVALAFYGILGVLGGLGFLATRAIFGLEKITNKIYQDWLDQKELDKENKLNELDRRLCGDKDPRPESCLRQLRAYSKTIQELGIQNGIYDDFDRLFQVCIKKIDQTDSLYKASRSLRGTQKTIVKEQREKIVLEIESTTEQLGQMIEQYRMVGNAQTEVELVQAKQEFQKSLEIAKKVDRRLADIDNKGYDPKDFE